MSDGAAGRTLTEEQPLDHASLARFAVAIGDAPDAVPPLAHWAWFPDVVADDGIGADGHPRRGGFLPALDHLPRRMFASAETEFRADLILDAAARLETRIVSVRETAGRTGPLAFVELDRLLSQEGAVRVAERRTLVYRTPGDALPLPADDGAGGWRPGPVELFRFSAATFNAHRIHYDRDYARDVEGYPGLVVHGPFTASRLAALTAVRGPLARFAFRAQAPLFAGQSVTLADRGGGRFEAVRGDGAVAMTAEAAWR